MGKRDPKRPLDDDAQDHVIVNRLLGELRRSGAQPQIISQTPAKQSRPETPVKQPRPETPVYRPRPGTPVKQPRSETPVYRARSETQVKRPRPEAPVKGPRAETPVYRRPQAPVKQAGPQAPVKQAGPQTPVKQARPQTPVMQARPQTPIKQVRPQTPVKQVRPQTPVKQARPQTPIKQGRPQAPVQRGRSETPVRRPGPEAPVKRARPQLRRRNVVKQDVRVWNTGAPRVHEQWGGVGYDIRVVGKMGRLLIGGALVLGPLWVILTDASWWLKVQIALSVGAIFAIYWVAYRVLGELVLRRVSPWVGLILLEVPPTVLILYPSPDLPTEIRVGVLLYVGVGLLVNILANYGGCEVLALQSLMYKRWYKVYCPINVLDAVEDAVVGIEVPANRPES